MKLNTDGSFQEVDDRMGAGGLLRENFGNWLGGFSWTGLNGNPFLAEVIALREGLVFAWNQGHREVLCEVDCRELTTVLASSENWRFHAQARLRREIRVLLALHWHTRISWIKIQERSQCTGGLGSRKSLL